LVHKFSPTANAKIHETKSAIGVYELNIKLSIDSYLSPTAVEKHSFIIAAWPRPQCKQ